MHCATWYRNNTMRFMQRPQHGLSLSAARDFFHTAGTWPKLLWFSGFPAGIYGRKQCLTLLALGNQNPRVGL